jgi:hypothetical protein
MDMSCTVLNTRWLITIIVLLIVFGIDSHSVDTRAAHSPQNVL